MNSPTIQTLTPPLAIHENIPNNFVPFTDKEAFLIMISPKGLELINTVATTHDYPDIILLVERVKHVRNRLYIAAALTIITTMGSLAHPSYYSLLGVSLICTAACSIPILQMVHPFKTELSYVYGCLEKNYLNQQD